MAELMIQFRESNAVVEVSFPSKALCSAACRFEFCSRLMFKLKPNNEGVWMDTDTPRVHAYILGFPPHINWVRTDDKTLVGRSDNRLPESYRNELSVAIAGIEGEQENEFQKRLYSFAIQDVQNKRMYNYQFQNRSRAVVAFCVLWDQQDHPRDHLEVTRHPNLRYLVDYPEKNTPGGTKTYGDPSKTVDELRNEGFPRDTDQSPRGVFIQVSRTNSYDTLQEHYSLLNRAQSVNDQVGRSNIPERYKKALYRRSSFTCNNCGQEFGERYLSPDHRVPSIVAADNLSENNYLTVLQTLCVRCNQVKREACKKCPYDHECTKCAWAYPEQNALSVASFQLLKAEAEEEGIPVNELVETYFSK